MDKINRTHQIMNYLLKENYDSPDTKKWDKAEINNAAMSMRKGNVDAKLLNPDNINTGGSKISMDGTGYETTIKPKILYVMPYLKDAKFSADVRPMKQEKPKNDLEQLYPEYQEKARAIQQGADNAKIAFLTINQSFDLGMNVCTLHIHMIHDLYNMKGQLQCDFFVEEGGYDGELDKEPSEEVRRLNSVLTKLSLETEFEIPFENQSIMQAFMKLDTHIKGMNRLINQETGLRIF
jgi:hypothetical protein